MLVFAPSLELSRAGLEQAKLSIHLTAISCHGLFISYFLRINIGCNSKSTDEGSRGFISFGAPVLACTGWSAWAHRFILAGVGKEVSDTHRVMPWRRSNECEFTNVFFSGGG